MINPEFIKVEVAPDEIYYDGHAESTENTQARNQCYETNTYGTIWDDGNIPGINKDTGSDVAHTPPKIAEVVEPDTNDLISRKSDTVYNTAYQKFLRWCAEKGVATYPESVFLTYFSEMESKMKSSTMWSHYSMLKALLSARKGVDISKYLKLRAYLKKQNEGYTPKKSRVFSKEQFEKFLFEACDEMYLGMKVVLIMGISGACRCEELVKLKVDEIEDLGSLIYVKIPDSKTNRSRSFTIVGETFISYYRRYAELRPKDMKERRFFLRYVNGKCHRSVMGIHRIGNVPRDVASYLKLTNWKEYTGHCLRLTSASLYIVGGTNLTFSRRYGARRCNTIARSYSEDSPDNRNEETIRSLLQNTNPEFNHASTEVSEDIQNNVPNNFHVTSTISSSD